LIRYYVIILYVEIIGPKVSYPRQVYLRILEPQFQIIKKLLEDN